MLSVKNLRKNYGSRAVLNNITVDLEKGKIFGLLGRNGAGKTTMLKILSNQIMSYDGEVFYDGETIRENQSCTEKIILVYEGMIPSHFHTEKISTIFKYAATILKNWDEEYKDRLLKEFGIDGKTKYKKLSKGNQNIICLIIGLASNSEVVFFDEPSVGLDANNRYKFYELLMKDIEEKGRLCIISTHIIDEAENVFENVLILEDEILILNEEISEIQRKSLTLSGSKDVLQKIKDTKKVIKEETIGAIELVSIFDELNNEERDSLISNGVDISPLHLQKLFVFLTDRKEIM